MRRIALCLCLRTNTPSRHAVSLIGVAGEGSRASGFWYSRAVGSGIYINVGTTWHVGSKTEAMGVRPARPGGPGDLVALWLRRVFGEHQSRGSACYGSRRTPQYWSRVYRKHANLTQAEFLPHLQAKNLELRTVMLCPEARSYARTIPIPTNSRTHTSMHHVPCDRQCSDYMASAVAMVRVRKQASAAPHPPPAPRPTGAFCPFHGTVFPFMAYELGLDSVQIRTADPAGGSAGASEIVLTGHSGAGDECCRGCTARERALSCLAPLFTCGSVELRTGWQASRRCECDGRPVGLNCDLG